MHIRPIQQADIEAAVDVVGRMVEEGSGFKFIPFSPEVSRGWFTAAVERPQNVFCAILEREGKVVGGMLGSRGLFSFSAAQLAFEMGLYILPEYRGGRYAVGLINSFEDWARAQGCVCVQSGVTIGINDELASELYRKLGYKDAGTLFRKEL
jgi:GNAT superfamily N-acetyltransferase